MCIQDGKGGSSGALILKQKEKGFQDGKDCRRKALGEDGGTVPNTKPSLLVHVFLQQQDRAPSSFYLT